MAETVSMPKLGFDMQEGTLVRWVRVEGDAVEKGQVLAEIETDKATVEVEAPLSGVIYKHLVEQGSIVPIGTPIVIIAAPGEKVEDAPAAAAAAEPVKKEAAPVSEAAPSASAVVESAASGDGRVKASPLARRMAQEKRINLATLKGSGPGGRVVRKDIEAALAAVPAPSPEPAVVQPVAAAAVPVEPTWTAGEIPADQHIPLNRLRSAIGRRLVESKQSVPHFYVTHNYNAEPLLALRSELNKLLPDDQKLTVNDFIVKAVALALRQFSNINASISGNELVRHGHVNVGVAVAVEGGLLTIACRDADQKPLRVISREVRDMAGRARSGKVRPEDVEGSTFSISNLGMYDVEEFIAIINPPEAAILAVGSAQKMPVVDGDTLRIGTRMRMTISADHRVTDGAEAAQFMQALATFIEEPMRLVL